MKFVTEERGAATIILAAAIAVLLGMAALVTDGGLLYMERARLIQMVDASVLAGIKEVPSDPDQAVRIAEDYVQRNGGREGEYEVSVINDFELNVTATREVRLFLGVIFGEDSGRVGASSAAQIGALSGYKGIVPIGIIDQEFEFGKLYMLKVGPSDSNNGTFGALALGKPGASLYEQYLKEGFNQMVRTGNIIDTETGNMSGPTLRAIRYRLGQDDRVPPNTWDDFDKNAPQLMIVPVYQPYQVESSQIKKVEILGFAAFFVESVSQQGNDSYINGRFVRTVLEGEVSISRTQRDYGALGVRLTQ
ncbi:MAG: pilus assembly protein TadG-related protein [Bacillota bacterium]